MLKIVNAIQLFATKSRIAQPIGLESRGESDTRRGRRLPPRACRTSAGSETHRLGYAGDLDQRGPNVFQNPPRKRRLVRFPHRALADETASPTASDHTSKFGGR